MFWECRYSGALRAADLLMMPRLSRQCLAPRTTLLSSSTQLVVTWEVLYLWIQYCLPQLRRFSQVWCTMHVSHPRIVTSSVSRYEECCCLNRKLFVLWLALLTRTWFCCRFFENENFWMIGFLSYFDFCSLCYFIFDILRSSACNKYLH